MKTRGWAAIIGAVAMLVGTILTGTVALLNVGEKTDTSYEILAEEINDLKAMQVDDQKELDEVNEWIRLLVVSKMEAPYEWEAPLEGCSEEDIAELEAVEEPVSLPEPPPPPPPAAAAPAPRMQQQQLPRTLSEAIEKRE